MLKLQKQLTDSKQNHLTLFVATLTCCAITQDYVALLSGHHGLVIVDSYVKKDQSVD